jgi:hypothetical protein
MCMPISVYFIVQGNYFRNFINLLHTEAVT